MNTETIERIREKILNRTIYYTKKYIAWRDRVFKRDRFTCLWCGRRGGKLNAHHIKRKYNFPRLIYKVTNGITLCKKCHDKVYKKEDRYVAFFRRLVRLGVRKRYGKSSRKNDEGSK